MTKLAASTTPDQLNQLAGMFKGALDFYYWKGIPVARSWPYFHGFCRNLLLAKNWQAFAEIQHQKKTLPPEIIAGFKEITKGCTITWADAYTIYAMNYFSEFKEPPPQILALVQEITNSIKKLVLTTSKDVDLYLVIPSKFTPSPKRKMFRGKLMICLHPRATYDPAKIIKGKKSGTGTTWCTPYGVEPISALCRYGMGFSLNSIQEAWQNAWDDYKSEPAFVIYASSPMRFLVLAHKDGAPPWVSYTASIESYYRYDAMSKETFQGEFPGQKPDKFKHMATVEISGNVKTPLLIEETEEIVYVENSQMELIYSYDKEMEEGPYKPHHWHVHIRPPWEHPDPPFEITEPGEYGFTEPTPPQTQFSAGITATPTHPTFTWEFDPPLSKVALIGYKDKKGNFKPLYAYLPP